MYKLYYVSVILKMGLYYYNSLYYTHKHYNCGRFIQRYNDIKFRCQRTTFRSDDVSRN